MKTDVLYEKIAYVFVSVDQFCTTASVRLQ